MVDLGNARPSRRKALRTKTCGYAKARGYAVWLCQQRRSHGGQSGHSGLLQKLSAGKVVPTNGFATIVHDRFLPKSKNYGATLSLPLVGVKRGR